MDKKIESSDFLNLKDYLTKKNFVHFLSVDSIENVIIFNNNSLEGLSLHISVGTCFVTASIDSIVLFSVTLISFLFIIS